MRGGIRRPLIAGRKTTDGRRRDIGGQSEDDGDDPRAEGKVEEQAHDSTYGNRFGCSLAGIWQSVRTVRDTSGASALVPSTAHLAQPEGGSHTHPYWGWSSPFLHQQARWGVPCYHYP